MCIHVMEGVGLHDTFTVVNTVHLELVLMEAVCMFVCTVLYQRGLVFKHWLVRRVTYNTYRELFILCFCHNGLCQPRY